MIYLIEDRDYLKIGYTKNIVERLKSYELHNCYAKLLAAKEGTLKDEEALHRLCKEYRHKGEGFRNCQEVKKIFSEYQWDGEEGAKSWIDYMNLRANAIKENWTGYGISIKGLKELNELDIRYKKYKQTKTKLALEELKINYITGQYFDIQNNAIYSCFMKPKPHIGDEFELYDNIKVMYGKKQ